MRPEKSDAYAKRTAPRPHSGWTPILVVMGSIFAAMVLASTTTVVAQQTYPTPGAQNKPAPSGENPDQPATKTKDSTWAASVEEPPVERAVDAYPEPEFESDFSAPDPATTRPIKSVLRVVSWHLDDAIAAGMFTRPKPTKKTWRHTFGGERRAQSSVKFDIEKFDADIVLLQGVRSVREIRQLFTARDWKIIVSRQLLKSLDNIHTGRRATLAKTGATAIAVRYQRGVRITGVRHLTQLASKPTKPTRVVDAAPSSAAPSDIASTKPETPPDVSAAGTAVRIYSGGKVRWIAAVAFSESCRNAPEQCREAEALRTWISKIGKTGDDNPLPIILGGQIPNKTSDNGDRWTWTAGGTEFCAHQRFDITPPPEDLKSQLLYETGCVLSVEIK